MPVWLDALLIIISGTLSGVIASVITLISSIKKSKSEMETLKEKHKQEIVRIEKEHLLQIDRMKLEHQQKLEMQNAEATSNMGAQFINPLMTSMMGTPEVQQILGKAVADSFKKNKK